MDTFEKEEEDHNRILAAGCIRASSYFGVEVFEINRDVKAEEINSKQYYHTSDTYRSDLLSESEKFNSEITDTRKKKGICLHYTEGQMLGDLQTLTGGNAYVSTPFLISRLGRIYQLSDPDRELSMHLGSDLNGNNNWYNNQVIGIELSNFGHVTNEILPENLEERTITLSKPFQNKSRFEKFTEEQYRSLLRLIDAIIRHYPQIVKKLLPLGVRYEYFGPGGLNKGEKLLNWRGISSHVNWARRNPDGSCRKWDIGPAFDWDRLANDAVCFPIGTPSPPAFSWYANTEMKRSGGYFPVGCNHMIHTGVHVFSDENEAIVRSMAEGYVVAFRFFSSERHMEQSRQLESLGLQHTNNTGFVLIRHDIEKLQKLTREGKIYTSQVLYTLYMDMEIVSENKMKQIPWISKLLEQKTNIPEDVLNTDTFESDGKVITFSEPVLPVTAGEIIGYTVKTQGKENYMHWEMFTTESNLLPSIMNMCNIATQQVSVESEDGIFSPKALRNLLGIRTRYIFPFMNFDLETDLKEHYAASDKKYTGNIIFGLSNRPIRSDTIFRAFSAGRELRCSLSGWKITISSEIRTNRDVREVRINVMDLVANRYSLEMTLQALEKTDEIRMDPVHGLQITASIDYKSFFKGFVEKENMLRNAVFSNISPWTEGYWKKTIKKLIELRCIDRGYQFKKEDFIEYILFDPDNEYPVYERIFRGAAAFINPMNELTYMHPVTFLWMYLLDKYNTIQFKSVLI